MKNNILIACLCLLSSSSVVVPLNSSLLLPEDQSQSDPISHPSHERNGAMANSSDANWETLIFTQRWPQIACFEWLEKNEHNHCSLPSAKNIWTIHGIWPNKSNSSHLGPFFCNRTWEFALSQIESIESELMQFWINVEKDTPIDGLWRHEWDKHGTCAAQIESLNSETKYFRQGLLWLHKYSMAAILESAGIVPDTDHPVEDIHGAVIQKLGVSPVIQCINHKDRHYLSEIRICFNRSLELVHCEGGNAFDVVTNCRRTEPIAYPSLVPPTVLRSPVATWKWRFPVNIYKLVHFIKWATL